MTKRPILFNLLFAGGFLVLTAGVVYAKKQGLVSGETPLRATMVVFGVFLAFQANFIPKKVAASARGRSVQRLAGWAFVLSGLAYGAVYLVLPLDWAAIASMVPVAAALLSVLTYCLWTRANARRLAAGG